MLFRAGLSRRTLALAPAIVLLSTPATASLDLPGRPAAPPSLVVLIVVDQMRPDYLDRFAAQLTGGLEWFRSHGAVFTQARQDHAITQTAPGHSTLLSGRAPSSTGIMTNDAGVPDGRVAIIDAPGAAGASPWRFQGTTLFDWMRASDPAARVLSVSPKDRSAILSVGRARGGVYWLVGNRFTTSTWYGDTLPSWLDRWNTRGIARLAGTEWSLLRPEAEYAERDALRFENGGRDVAFPHRMPVAPDSLTSRIGRYPWVDSLTLDVALDGVRSTALGALGHTDLLVVSLAATDAIGHDFGPDSREVHDQVLRLDRWLGWFLDSLAVMVPRTQTVYALTADHGMTSAPAFARDVGRRAGQVWLGDLADSAAQALQARYQRRFALAFQFGLFTGDLTELRAAGIDVDSLAESLGAAARRRPGVSRVYTRARIGAAPTSDVFAARWRRSIPPATGWLVAAVPEPGFIWGISSFANHGSAQEDDVRVPLVIAAPGRVRPGTYRRAVTTMDIAPTLARVLGIRPQEPLTGRPLTEVPGR
ncbi:MAG: alkaline phosphatase family protein [Gemmatimonadales bacterium]|nr:alkaline phosphatase family protein [Gemmatimonadales bacterium]